MIERLPCSYPHLARAEAAQLALVAVGGLAKAVAGREAVQRIGEHGVGIGEGAVEIEQGEAQRHPWRWRA